MLGVAEEFAEQKGRSAVVRVNLGENKATRSGWFIRSRYQGVPHWFVRGSQVSICGLLKFSRWASDPEPFKKVPRNVGQAIGCFFCLKKKNIARGWV